ncbi:DegT/DnrJ/EryC1/StrS family aminotransferase [Methylobacterium sp. C25]|uniref:DegT/DnrJ/EryC1/StrS family aminotransferase n=1 Tax=Methylobacterium sp. C25 TaxID=2721622 RepID=UPI001F2E5E36|nr:DegT/DnrJ/EryC1/StrS family aminotransferase [Methylobacterium sp. C25]MCE4226371.1 DegT/DnrJ/EryC1/StrS family aminotransferase [Methylobacterium sp. C25]
MSYRYPLATTTWSDEEFAAIGRVVESGVFSMGKEVLEFERRFADWQGSRYSVMVNSGSSANLLMVASLFYCKASEFRLERGDEVIVPAISWSTTFFPLVQYGLKLKFVDIDPFTLNMDISGLKSAITERTRCVFLVNLLGNANQFDVVRGIIQDKNIFVLEDNCESLGATYKGSRCGSFGVMGSFSTFFSHHISTMEGGLIVTDDEEFYHILLSLRAHGWTRNLPKYNNVTGVKSDDLFEESFKFVLPGYNVRPLEMSGAIGIEQIKKIDRIVAERRANAGRFVEAMYDHPDLMIQKEVGESSWFGFSLVVRPESSLTRKELVLRLGKAGFECRPIVAGNFTRNPVMQYVDSSDFGKLDNADRVTDFGVFIGNHHYDMGDAFSELSRI